MAETPEPRVERARFDPAYGTADVTAPLSWEWARERLERSRNYWIGTTRPDGKPHAMPVWGALVDDTVVFGTARQSQKARNLGERRDVVVHLESGDEAVILEGVAEETNDLELLARAADVFEAKYDWRPGLDDFEGTVWYVVRPQVGYAWLESDYVSTRTRYVWEA
jgi:nitroimidazol reductase NimA-like FMN-containing flavoprotein (pyridoxamine 5'-phosphate oxidase superfamily)